MYFVHDSTMLVSHPFDIVKTSAELKKLFISIHLLSWEKHCVTCLPLGHKGGKPLSARILLIYGLGSLYIKDFRGLGVIQVFDGNFDNSGVPFWIRTFEHSPTTAMPPL